MKPKGWVKEPDRHSLAARGIPTTPEAKRIEKGIDAGKRLIGDYGSELEKLANEMQDRNYDHYGDADLQEVIEALADVPELGDPEKLYAARRRFRAVGDEMVLNDEEHKEFNSWKQRINGLIAEYEDWLADEGLVREELLPLMWRTKETR